MWEFDISSANWKRDGIYTCENLTFHLQTEKDVKFVSVRDDVFTQRIDSLKIAVIIHNFND
jgi:hypothetical protein